MAVRLLTLLGSLPIALPVAFAADPVGIPPVEELPGSTRTRMADLREAATEKSFAAPPIEAEMRVVDIRELTLTGLGWEVDDFDGLGRLPRSAASSTPKRVWESARRPAGVAASFLTDAETLTLEWSAGDGQSTAEVPATRSHGFDLYLRDEDSTWRHVRTVEITPSADGSGSATLFEGQAAQSRALRLYLPLDLALESVRLVADGTATLDPLDPSRGELGNPLVLFGGADVAGAGNSRPGLSLAATLGRRMDRVVVNLGFDTEALLSLELGGLLAEVNASVFVLDVMSTVNAATLEVALEPFIAGLRAARPWSSVLIVDQPTPPAAQLDRALALEFEERRRIQRSTMDRLSSTGVTGIYHLDQEALLGLADRWTVDGRTRGDGAVEHLAEVLASASEPLVRAWADRREQDH